MSSFSKHRLAISNSVGTGGRCGGGQRGCESSSRGAEGASSHWELSATLSLCIVKGGTPPSSSPGIVTQVLHFLASLLSLEKTAGQAACFAQLHGCKGPPAIQLTRLVFICFLITFYFSILLHPLHPLLAERLFKSAKLFSTLITDVILKVCADYDALDINQNDLCLEGPVYNIWPIWQFLNW